ncbi:MAG: alpha/beta fold hydrolase [Burkholderiales bacterium]
MARDPQVDLIFSHFTPRYIGTGVDPNDLNGLVARIDNWADWCRIWSEEARRHEGLAVEAAGKRRRTTAAEGFLRASIYYHYAKHMFANSPEEYRTAHENMLRCYMAAAPDVDPPMQRIEFPFQGGPLSGYLRRPRGATRPPVAIILPGLDACKEELHAWSNAFLKRGLATLALDGPGQGETAFRLPISADWGGVIGAVIDALEQRSDVDGNAVGVVGQSLGAFYAPLAAAGESRIKACIANCGPFDFGALLPKLPKLSQEVFRVRSRSRTQAEAQEFATQLTLEGKAERIRCPLLVVFGGGDRLVPPSEGERLVRAASGATEFVIYEEGNHVCFNISYKFRPLTGDWMAEALGVRSGGI